MHTVITLKEVERINSSKVPRPDLLNCEPDVGADPLSRCDFIKFAVGRGAFDQPYSIVV